MEYQWVFLAVVITRVFENVQMAALSTYLVTGLQIKDKGIREHVVFDPFLKWLCRLQESGFHKFRACVKVICLWLVCFSLLKE